MNKGQDPKTIEIFAGYNYLESWPALKTDKNISQVLIAGGFSLTINLNRIIPNMKEK